MPSPTLIKTLVGFTCWPRGYGFCYGLESCIVDVGLPLCPRATFLFRGRLYVWYPNNGKGIYVRGHGHVDLVALGLSKLVGRCCGLIFVTI